MKEQLTLKAWFCLCCAFFIPHSVKSVADHACVCTVLVFAGVSVTGRAGVVGGWSDSDHRNCHPWQSQHQLGCRSGSVLRAGPGVRADWRALGRAGAGLVLLRLRDEMLSSRMAWADLFVNRASLLSLSCLRKLFAFLISSPLPVSLTGVMAAR